MTANRDFKDQFDILDKIESFERHIEFNRFLLILAFGGFIAFFAGWMDFISKKFLGINMTFFQFAMVPSDSQQPINEPILFLSTWMIFFMLVSIMILFTTGSSGLISWNKTYRIIGVFSVFLYLITSLIVLLIGYSNSKYLPVLWGTAILIGFVISGYLLSKRERYQVINKILNLNGLISLILGIFFTFILSNEFSLFFFLSSFGIIMIFMSAISYLLIGKKNIIKINL
ncbi:MAG: hypothetical protein ACFFD1_15105 [Candidatus Thorarchaeota archaeon]